jgi:hypothetical protein
MQSQEIKDERPHLGENDPPLDLTRENAAFERERARLVRDHLGQVALIHGDDVIGAFPTANEAIVEGYRRFGLVRLIVRPITAEDEVLYAPHLDINHPSVRRID